MDKPQHSSTESIGDFIHKEKVSKRKHKAISLLAIGQKDNRTIGASVAHAVNDDSTLLAGVLKATEQQEQAIEQKEKAIATSRAQILNTQIDQYLFELVSNGLVDINFKAWFAKAIHTLGLQEVNYIVINVKQTQNCTNRQKLLSYKIKGALNYHYKLVYESESLDGQQG